MGWGNLAVREGRLILGLGFFGPRIGNVAFGMAVDDEPQWTSAFLGL